MDEANTELWRVGCQVANTAPNTGMVVLHSRTVIAAQADLEALRKDAERYRWMRNDFGVMGANIDGQHSWAYRRNFSLRGPTLDAAIDRAVAAEREGGPNVRAKRV